jgi:membrane-bound lytic murein transglycosylase D
MRRNLVYVLGVVTGGLAGGAPAFPGDRLAAVADALKNGKPAPVVVTAPTTSGPSAASLNLSEESGRWGAESPELRMLRRAESNLFPSGQDALAEPVASSEPAEPAACEVSRSENWYAPRSVRTPQSSWWQELNMPDLPMQQHPAIAKYIRYFSSSPEGRKIFTTWLRRSGRYRELIGRALRQRDLPRDLISVVFIESGFWPTAVSSAGAVGLWQFMPETARAYGLKVERAYDERQSIFQSTSAAADHLADLHARFHSWELALAAYNMGYRRLGELLRGSATEDFWSLREVSDSLPRETALYVPKVLAVAVLLSNLERFDFGDIAPMAALDASDMEVQPGIRLSLIARAAGTSVRNLRELNPHLRGDILPDRGEPLAVYVPSRGIARAREMLPLLIQREDQSEIDREVSADFDWSRDEPDREGRTRLERTDSDLDPARAARLERTDPDPKRAARLERADPAPDRSIASDFWERTARPSEGTAERTSSSWRIREEAPTPARGRERPASRADEGRPRSQPALTLTEGERIILYKVARGDTLSSVATAFNTTEQELARANDLRDPSRIIVGQVLRLSAPSNAPAPKAAPETAKR